MKRKGNRIILFIILLYVNEVAAWTMKQSGKPFTIMHNPSNGETRTPTKHSDPVLRRGDITTESASTIDDIKSIVSRYSHEGKSSLLDTKNWDSDNRIHAD